MFVLLFYLIEWIEVNLIELVSAEEFSCECQSNLACALVLLYWLLDKIHIFFSTIEKQRQNPYLI